MNIPIYQIPLTIESGYIVCVDYNIAFAKLSSLKIY